MNLVTQHALILGVGAVTAAAALTGCSTSKESGPSTSTSSASASTSAPSSAAAAPATGENPAPGTARVTLNAADLGPATGVNCQTTDNEITIAIESTPRTIVVLTDEATPGVTSVSIGELGADGPSAAYIPGVSEATPTATRDGKTYTVTGTGTGTDPADPGKPADLPFQIAVTCP